MTHATPSLTRRPGYPLGYVPKVLAMLAGLLVFLGGGLEPVQAAPSLQQTFQQAADEFDVPAGMLMGVSYTTSSWHQARGLDPHSAQEFGIMGLRSQDEGPSLEAAAALLNLPVQVVRDDPVQNIRGGAALLAAYARAANHGQPVSARIDLETLEAWWDALGTWAGISDSRYQDIFAVHVFEVLDQGLEGRSEEGETLYLAPMVLPNLLEDWILDARARLHCRADTTATDYPDATWVAACSSNYTDSSRTASSISYVVIHVSEGSYAGTISWFQNCSSQVSAHYVVSKYGEVTQMVREADIAWHAGNWDYNEMSVGIEHEGYTYEDDITDAEYQASAALTANVCDRNGIPKSRTYIIGHSEVPGSTHTDPGPYWDWDYYMDLVNGGAATTTGDLLGFVREDDIYNGAGVPGATVRLNTGASTTAGSDGLYHFYDLEAGTYNITASAPCYNTVTITRTVAAGVDNWGSIALTEDPTCGATGDISGTIVDAGTQRPIIEALVSTNTGLETLTDRDGTFAFTGLSAGSYVVTAEADCYSTATVTVTVTGGGVADIDLALTKSDTCGPSCDPPDTLMRPANLSGSRGPITDLPWSSAGLFLLFGGSFILFRRQRR